MQASEVRRFDASWFGAASEGWDGMASKESSS
jgi:hypothetical protein